MYEIKNVAELDIERTTMLMQNNITLLYYSFLGNSILKRALELVHVIKILPFRLVIEGRLFFCRDK